MITTSSITTTVAMPQDTAVGAAYVTKPTGPPDNSGYMYAAYGIAIAIYGGYIVLLLRRNARLNRTARRTSRST